MIQIYPYENLGQVDHGWLQARHHFSFSSYHDPKRIHFGNLRVINDDRIAPGRGFAPHSHQDMEIITYVREGAISHEDSLGNKGRTEAGDVQVMSAGTGVTHAEFNWENTLTRLYQIWIFPNKNQVTPRWDSKVFPKDFIDTQLPVLVSGKAAHRDAEALFIHQDAAIYGGKMKNGQRIEQNLLGNAYLLASFGEFTVNNQLLKAGDGAEITEENSIIIQAHSDCEVLIIEV